MVLQISRDISIDRILSPPQTMVYVLGHDSILMITRLRLQQVEQSSQLPEKIEPELSRIESDNDSQAHS
jgi:hypothetical protein